MKILIVVPAYNEERIIRHSIVLLYSYMEKSFSAYDWSIIVSDNNSKDATKDIVLDEARTRARLKYLFVAEKGKGIAIRRAWEANDADIYCFMDADLSTDLEALPLLVGAIEKDAYDIACGSRTHKDSKVQRSGVRKIVSFGYRIILKLVFGLSVGDAPCGFKAINNNIKKFILPKVQNNEWFFDSELIILSEKSGYTIQEIPVHWSGQEEAGRVSKVNIFSLSFEYMKKVFELRRRLA